MVKVRMWDVRMHYVGESPYKVNYKCVYLCDYTIELWDHTYWTLIRVNLSKVNIRGFTLKPDLYCEYHF